MARKIVTQPAVIPFPAVQIPQQITQNQIDAKLERIGAHIYESFQYGQIAFDVGEASLAALNTCTDTRVLGIPENYLTRDEFEQAIEEQQEIQRTHSPKTQAWRDAH